MKKILMITLMLISSAGLTNTFTLDQNFNTEEEGYRVKSVFHITNVNIKEVNELTKKGKASFVLNGKKMTGVLKKVQRSWSDGPEVYFDSEVVIAHDQIIAGSFCDEEEYAKYIAKISFTKEYDQIIDVNVEAVFLDYFYSVDICHDFNPREERLVYRKL